MDFLSLDYYILGEIVACVLSLILCGNVFFNFSLLDKRKRMFGYAGLSTFLAAFFDIGAVVCITYYKKIPLYLGTFCSTIYFLNLLAIPFFMLCYALDIAYSFNSKKKKTAFIFAIVQYSVYVVIILINIWTGIVFRYDCELGYVRGPLKYMTYILTYLFTIEAFISLIINRRYIPKRLFLVFAIYPFISLCFVFIQMLNNKILLSGVSSISALLFAYLTIQSDLVDYDYVTGLMTEAKLRRNVSAKKSNGVLYIFSIDNMNDIQSNMDALDLNNVLLRIGKELANKFEGSAYHISTNRFAAVGDSEESVKQKACEIEFFLRNLHKNADLNIPKELEIYSAAIGFSKGNYSYNNLIEIINIMLVKAKTNNAKQISLCDEAVFADLESKKNIFTILKRELNPDSSMYQVWFQPIYSISEKKFTHCEALSRLVDTEIGNVPPSEFIYIAEIKGLIEKLGIVSFERVCKFIAQNKDVVNSVSVNFSASEMLKSTIFDNVMGIINKYGLSPSNIIVEITESIFIDDFVTVRENMIKLNNAGIEFYLDDFGTGFSNLANVVGLPFSTIKMDRTFVLMMEKSKKALSLFRNLVLTFKDAKLKILVEGVETDVQNQLVSGSDVDFIQGYLYSKPLPKDKCLEFLKKYNRS